MLTPPRPSAQALPFSQRNGIEAIPPQLKLGEASGELRRLLHYYITLEIDRAALHGSVSSYFEGAWKRVAMDLNVLFFKRDADRFENSPYSLQRALKEFLLQASFNNLFDLVEFFVAHNGCSETFKRELAEAFITARAAYRIIDHHVVAIGTDEQAEAFLRALSYADKNSAAVRTQLIAAGVALRDGNWAGSVRESIHAVEAMAVQFANGQNTLGAALNNLERNGHVHGGLKAAFNMLYGYASDEAGVRHALVFGDEAQVDEGDALFMLGACASFISYLAARCA